MRTAIYILAGLVLLALAMVVVGYLLPKQHRVAREQVFTSTPDIIFAAIATPAEYPRWRRGVERVEILASDDGKVHFREIGSNGAITYVVDETVPRQRVVSQITDKSLPFGGRWTFELTPVSGGTTVRIVEDGEVSNPMFRFMSRFVFGHHRGIEAFLSDLRRHLEPPG